MAKSWALNSLLEVLPLQPMVVAEPNSASIFEDPVAAATVLTETLGAVKVTKNFLLLWETKNSAQSWLCTQILQPKFSIIAKFWCKDYNVEIERMVRFCYHACGTQIGYLKGVEWTIFSKTNSFRFKEIVIKNIQKKKKMAPRKEGDVHKLCHAQKGGGVRGNFFFYISWGESI